MEFGKQFKSKVMSDIMLNNVELGDTGSESREKINKNAGNLKAGITDVDSKYNNLDKQNFKKSDVSQVLGSTDTRVPSEKAVKDALSEYPKKNEVLIGTILKGNKDNEAEIKAIVNPNAGDTYKALDTRHFWTFDGSQWNDIGEILPSNTATQEDLTKLSDNVLGKVDGIEDILGKGGGGSEVEIMAFSGVTNRASVTPGGQWFYENYSLLFGKFISKVKVNIQTAGVFSVIIGRNIGTSNYTFEAIPFNVTAGVRELNINRQLQPNESIGFLTYTDTARFYFADENTSNVQGGGFIGRSSSNVWDTVKKFNLCIGVYVSEGGELGANFVKKLDLEQNYSPSSDKAPSSKLLNDLQTKLYEGENTEITEKEIVPLVNGLQNSVLGQWFYKNQNLFKGAKITQIKANFGTTGKFTVNIATGIVNSGTASIDSRQEYTITQTGVQTIILTNPITLLDGQILGFGSFTDSAFFKCGSNPKVPNPIGGSFSGLAQNKNWGSENTDELGICVIGEISSQNGDIPSIYNRLNKLETSEINTDLQLKGRTFSVLADSISTYQGLVPSGHPSEYPNTKSGISSYLQTWWGILIDKYKMELKANASWSGGTICGTGNGSLPNYISKLGENPDFIFVFGGTNDFGTQKQIGEFNFYQTQDRNVFKQALCYMIDTMRSAYPNSRIIYLTSMQRNYSSQSNGKFPNKVTDAMPFLYEYNDAVKEACKIYGVEVVDMYNCGINWVNMDTYLYDRIHPNSAGMALMADFLYKNII